MPGYREPEWPLELRINRTPEEASANGDRPPAPFAYWRRHGVVNAAVFGPGTMRMEKVVRHELAHGFLETAFPADPNGAVFSGWMTEAFPQWIYAVSAEHPNEPRFWSTAERWLTPVLEELRDGKNVLGKLRRMDYATGRRSPLAAIGGLLTDFCAADELRWEGFARFTAAYVSYREKRSDFELLLGSSEQISRELAAWARTRTARFDWGSEPESAESGAVGNAANGIHFQGRSANQWAARLRDRARAMASIQELEAAGIAALPILKELAALGGEARRHSVYIAGRLEKPGLPLLIECLSGEDPECRAIAASALRMRPMPPEVVDPMLTALEAREHLVKANVFAALERAPTEDPRVVKVMIRYLDSDNYDYRMRAAKVLAAMGDAAIPAGREAIERRLETEERTSVRLCFALCLWKLGQSAQRTLAIVIAELEADRPRREYAAKIAGQFGKAGAPALPHLLELAQDPNWGVRASVAYAFARIGVRSKEVLAAVEKLGEDEKDRVRRAAAHALQRLTP